MVKSSVSNATNKTTNHQRLKAERRIARKAAKKQAKKTAKRARKKKEKKANRPVGPTFVSRIGDTLAERIRKTGEWPFPNGYVEISSLTDDEAPITLGYWPCDANSKGMAAEPSPILIKNINEVLVSTSYIDVRGSKRKRWQTESPHKQTYICSDFAVHERIDSDYQNGKKRRTCPPGTLENELMALLPRLRDLPSCSVSIAYRLEIKSNSLRIISFASIYLLSRFSPEEAPQWRTHNAHLLD